MTYCWLHSDLEQCQTEAYVTVLFYKTQVENNTVPAIKFLLASLQRKEQPVI